MHPLHLFAICTFVVAAYGQTVSESARHLDLALELERQGQLDRAGREYKAAIESADRKDGSELLRALDNACTYYQDSGLMPQAESCLKRLMTTYQAAIGHDHLRLNRVVNRLACLYIEMGMINKVDRLKLDRWLARLEDEDPNSTDRIQMTGTMAGFEIIRGAPLAALRLNEKAWEILTRRGETQTKSGITILTNMAIAHTDMHRYSEAAEILRRAIQVGEKVGLQDSLTMAAALANLSQVYASLNMYSDAEKQMGEALRIIELRCGKDSTRTAAVLASYAPLLRKLGRKPEAQAMESRAKKIAEVTGIASFARQTVDVSDLARGRGLR